MGSTPAITITMTFNGSSASAAASAAASASGGSSNNNKNNNTGITAGNNTTNSFPTSVTAPRAEEIAGGARRLQEELNEFLEQHAALQTASTVAPATTKGDVSELQLSTCRKLREVSIPFRNQRLSKSTSFLSFLCQICLPYTHI